MFGDAEPSEETPKTEPKPANNLDLINLDSISSRTIDEKVPARPSVYPPLKIFKPPLPPKRPTSFQVSQDYLERLTAPSAPSRPRRAAPIISPPSLADDSLNADLLAMDVMDIYENLNGIHKPDKEFVNIPPSNNVKTPAKVSPQTLQLTFGVGSANLTEAHAIHLDEELLPSLKNAAASRFIIETSLPQDADKEDQRLTLSRAIAVRNYLELNGIARNRVDIKLGYNTASLSATNIVSITRVE